MYQLTTIYSIFRILLCFFLLNLVVVGVSKADETLPGKASVSKEFLIKLDTAGQLQSQYVADISALNFTEQEAAEFFAKLGDNLTNYAIDYASKKVIIKLHPELLNGRQWTVSSWNEYFQKKSEFFSKK